MSILMTSLPSMSTSRIFDGGRFVLMREWIYRFELAPQKLAGRGSINRTSHCPPKLNRMLQVHVEFVPCAQEKPWLPKTQCSPQSGWFSFDPTWLVLSDR
jgi:hypothetical protein